MNNRRKLIAGNWKMNKTSADAVGLAQEIVAAVGKQNEVDVVVCPPFTAVEAVGRVLEGSEVRLGGQNMHHEASGAFTGEVSAPMLRAIFASYVILGHSERRTLFGETDEIVNRKVAAALRNQLRPIFFVGETLAEREAGSTLKVVQTQVERGLEGVSREQATSVVIAYEPVWAIGTGKVATTAQAQEVHAFIRGLLVKLFGEPVAQRIRILYGGSMKPANAPEFLAPSDIAGGLIGRRLVDLVPVHVVGDLTAAIIQRQTKLLGSLEAPDKTAAPVAGQIVEQGAVFLDQRGVKRMRAESQPLHLLRRPGEAEPAVLFAGKGNQSVRRRGPVDRGIQIHENLPQLFSGFLRPEKFELLRSGESRHGQRPEPRQLGLILR